MAITSPAAQVTSSGITAPAYSDILLWLQDKFRSIYGSDVYLEEDSQDGQWLAVLAQAFNDCNNTAIAVYNSFSPSTAQGAGLSSVVKINGLSRLVASNSTASVTIVGQAGTIITRGVVADANDNQWDLPASVTIPLDGDIVVTATAQVKGNIEAPAGSITKVVTPTRGWQSVTNAADATPGAPVEDDATLRRRQAVSTSLPAQSVIEAIAGVVTNLPGVSALAYYENDTSATNSLGIPSHSISLVVKGGDNQTIAEAIAAKKTPGTGTYGTTSEQVFDSMGVPSTINFFRPTDVPVDVNITIKALTGYVSTTGTKLVADVAAYISSLGIGAGDKEGNGKVYLWRVGAVAALMGTGLEKTFDVTALTMRRDADPFAASDIDVAFNEQASCAIGDITLTVV